jgi:hypothetical protein
LDWKGMAVFRSLHYDDRANHLGGRSDIEVQRFAVLRRREDRCVGERRLELVESLLGLDGPGERSCFFRSR